MRTVTLKISTDMQGPFPLNGHDDDVAAAVKRVAEMDETDGRPISDLPIDMSLRTVMSALSCGLSGQMGCVADALVMLQQIECDCRAKSVEAQ